jgi:hypothetical protein
LQILRNRHGALVEGVLGECLVGVDGTQALKGHDLVVGGVAGSVLNHVELENTSNGSQGYITDILSEGN